MTTAAASHRLVTSEIRAALVGVACVAVVHVVTAQNAAIPPRVRSSSAVRASSKQSLEASNVRRPSAVSSTPSMGPTVWCLSKKGTADTAGARLPLLSVTVVGPNRLLRILVDLRKAPGCELVEAIGHELQHAVEVLHERRIRSDLQIHNFFDMLGRTRSERFETDKAMEAGLAVSREACRGH
jgi:hypothetical protein